ncbi:diguanylate cyclase (GGDEF)-like protein [Paenibacillus harenae]|uniref:Diguanylate cyclase (GGDEF)-like protein n=2 Tax=Paenibacillus harenae TaxID=306543 RepID=A0ABT9TW38_PAEHA|nr:diguanylate cyclase (GGDEF)-like protein [Paenibacillus harenae]
MTAQWSVFPYSSIIVVYAVMCAIAGLLFVKWRNKHYWHMSLNLSLGAVAAIISFIILDRITEWSLFSEGLLMLVFALQQIGLIRLFQPRLDKKLYVHMAALVLFGMGASMSLSAPTLVSSYILMLLALLFGAYSLFFTAKLLGMRLNYLVTLGLFACHAVLFWLSVLLNQTGVKHFSMLLLFLAQFFVLLMMIERMIQLMQAATYSSSRDDHTGLYNRRFFMQLMQGGIRSGTASGYILIRLDHLDEYKSKQGKEAYEQLLQIVASVVRSASEPQGNAGLLDGGDMAVLLTDRSARPAVMAEQIRSRIEGATNATASIGYVTVHPGSSVEQILKQAEQTVQLAAAAGSNKVFGHDALPEAQ